MGNKKQQDDLELEDRKVYKNLKKAIGEGECVAFFARETEDLKATIAACQMQMQEAREDVENCPEFEKASLVVKDFNAGLKLVCDPLKAKINAAAYILNGRKGVFDKRAEAGKGTVEISVNGKAIVTMDSEAFYNSDDLGDEDE